MNDTPEISVLICAYNAQRYLAEALESVLGQTMRAYEVVVVDDGSTDQTARILADAAQADPRVRVISGPNQGISGAANTGLVQCRAPLVARMDSDDLAEPDRLEKQVAFMNQHPDVLAAGSFVTFIDGRGRRLTVNRPPTEHDAIDDALMKGHCAIWNTSCVLRREAFLDAGGYGRDFKTAEDLDAWLRLAERGRLANIAEPLQRYRLHDASITAADGPSNRDDCRRACEAAAARRGGESRFEASSPWREGGDAGSKRKFYTRYGWWAWRLGERRTARHYALKAIGAGFWCAEPWRLFVKSWAPRKAPGVEATP